MDGFQTALFGRSQVAGPGKRAQICEQMPVTLQPPFELGGAGTDHRRRFGAKSGRGVLPESAAVGLVGHTIGRHQNHRVGGSQVVGVNDSQDAILIRCREPRQRRGHRRSDATAGQLVLRLIGEVRRELQAGLDPVRFMPQQVGRGVDREAIAFHQRAHDEGFVHRRECSRRRVGREQEAPVVGSVGWRFDDHRDLRVARVAPTVEPLEAVDDLVDVRIGG